VEQPHVKENCTWPLQQGEKGWRRLRFMDRLDAGIGRFVLVPKGSLLADPEFGTSYEECRTQGIGSGRAEMLQSDVEVGIPAQFPEVQVQEVRVDMGYRVGEDETFKVDVRWTLALPLGGEVHVTSTKNLGVSY